MLNIMEPHWGLVPDSYTYAAAFHAYDRTGQWEDALTLFEVLSDRGLVQKNAFLYNAIITVLGNAASAALLQKLQERPDIATFLIQFLGMTEQTDAISHVLDDMDAKSLLITGQPGVHLTHTYNTGILA